MSTFDLHFLLPVIVHLNTDQEQNLRPDKSEAAKASGQGNFELNHLDDSLTLLVSLYPDVISIEKTGEHFRLIYDVKGRFTVHRITAEEAKVR